VAWELKTSTPPRQWTFCSCSINFSGNLKAGKISIRNWEMEEAAVFPTASLCAAADSNSDLLADGSESLLCREEMQSCEEIQKATTALEFPLESSRAVQHDQCLTGGDQIALCSDASNVAIHSETRRLENVNHPVHDHSGAAGEPFRKINTGAGKLPGSENAAPTKRRSTATEKIGSKDSGHSLTHGSQAEPCAENGDPALQSIPPVPLEEDVVCGRTAIRLRAAAVPRYKHATSLRCALPELGLPGLVRPDEVFGLPALV
jgi:hypothetical protein